MGCTSSKGIETYRPTPSSYSLFDITAVEEPWLKNGDAPERKPNSHVPPQFLEKLKAIEDEPSTWDEASIKKALEDLKPKLKTLPGVPAPDQTANATPGGQYCLAVKRKLPRKSFSFHTLEELEANNMSSISKLTESERVGSVKPGLRRVQSSTKIGYGPDSELRNGVGAPEVPKSLKDNIFILRDRQAGKSLGIKAISNGSGLALGLP